jgi:hypothetical protein
MGRSELQYMLEASKREVERREAQLVRLGLNATFAQVDYWRTAQRLMVICARKLLEEDHDDI